ncbi:hypothetical protein Taro_020478 [Colocasia esculenta]|uniref:Uncharacterized protein n=1 Tax=Colocasia esculenta TaxID=4460 RepID=A0A843UZQ1_COLES|nr:hypothetical protein [Colocasia esculenta]
MERERRGGDFAYKYPPYTPIYKAIMPRCWSFSFCLGVLPDFSEFCPIEGERCRSLFFVLVLRTRSIDLVLPDFSVLRTLDGDMFSLYFHFNRDSGHHFKGRNSPAKF